MTDATISSPKRREWKASWPIPLIAAIGLGMSASPNLTLGALMTSIEADTGWSRLQISSGSGIISVLIVALAPFMGHAVDKFGSRRIALPGLIIFCSALAILAFTGGSIYAWWAGWTFLALGALCIKSTVWTAAVITRFEHSRGLAIAIALSGSGLAASTVPYTLTLLEQKLGWQGAYIGLAAIFAAISLPFAWLAFYDATDQVRRSGATAKAVDRSTLPGLRPRKIFRSRQFWQIATACLLVGTAVTSLTVHFIPLLISKGATSLTAAGIASGIGISSVAGRLVTGVLLDRYNATIIGLFAFALPAVACAMLLLDPGLDLAFPVAVLVGLAAGAEFDVIAYLTSRYFGVRHYGLAFGSVVGLLSLGAGLGPMMGAEIFDTFGSYTNMLLLVGPMFAISGILLITLGKYPVFENTSS